MTHDGDDCSLSAAKRPAARRWSRIDKPVVVSVAVASGRPTRNRPDTAGDRITAIADGRPIGNQTDAELL
eukprot:4666849-Alexandrium_andersonii.AAC.1